MKFHCCRNIFDDGSFAFCPPPSPTQVAGKPSVVGLPSQARAEFFGSGVLDSLREEVGSHADLTAVFISTYRLRSSQRTALEEAFGGLPVIDRYGLVLQIFQRHAQTKEARRVLKVLFFFFCKERLWTLVG